MNKLKKLIISAFAAILMVQTAGASYASISETDSMYPIVSTLAEAGIVQGVGDDDSALDESVSNIEAVAAIQKAFRNPSAIPENIYDTNLNDLDWVDSQRYSDFDQKITLENACHWITSLMF